MTWFFLLTSWLINYFFFFNVSDEGRDNSKGVLVHCLAGVSRSVTITVAYLMYKLNLSLNDAFNLVRNRKSNIAPNFHFMEQLHNFEQELKTHGTLPDVSIRFQRVVYLILGYSSLEWVRDLYLKINEAVAWLVKMKENFKKLKNYFIQPSQ